MHIATYVNENISHIYQPISKKKYEVINVVTL